MSQESNTNGKYDGTSGGESTEYESIIRKWTDGMIGWGHLAVVSLTTITLFTVLFTSGLVGISVIEGISMEPAMSGDSTTIGVWVDKDYSEGDVVMVDARWSNETLAHRVVEDEGRLYTQGDNNDYIDQDLFAGMDGDGYIQPVQDDRVTGVYVFYFDSEDVPLFGDYLDRDVECYHNHSE